MPVDSQYWGHLAIKRNVNLQFSWHFHILDAIPARAPMPQRHSNKDHSQEMDIESSFEIEPESRNSEWELKKRKMVVYKFFLVSS